MTHRFLFITHQLSRTGAPLVLSDVILYLKSKGNDKDFAIICRPKLNKRTFQLFLGTPFQTSYS